MMRHSPEPARHSQEIRHTLAESLIAVVRRPASRRQNTGCSSISGCVQTKPGNIVHTRRHSSQRRNTCADHEMVRSQNCPTPVHKRLLSLTTLDFWATWIYSRRGHLVSRIKKGTLQLFTASSPSVNSSSHDLLDEDYSHCRSRGGKCIMLKPRISIVLHGFTCLPILLIWAAVNIFRRFL